MKLQAYLKREGVTVREFAERLGRPVETVRNWVYCQKTPSLEAASAITDATAGAVQTVDLIAPRTHQPAEAA